MNIVENAKEVKPRVSKSTWKAFNPELLHSIAVIERRVTALDQRLTSAEVQIDRLAGENRVLNEAVRCLKERLRRVDKRTSRSRRDAAILARAPAPEIKAVPMASPTFQGLESLKEQLATPKNIEEQVREFLDQGLKVHAIKAWKDHYDCDLKTAKDQVEALMDTDLVGAQ